MGALPLSYPGRVGVSKIQGPAQRLSGLASQRFVRFLLVGVLNTAFGYSCFALLLWLGLHYALALLLATIVGVLFSFVTTGGLVFSRRENRLLGRFIAVYGVVYTANLAGLKLLSLAGLSAYWGGAILLLPVALLAYILNKRFVFAP